MRALRSGAAVGLVLLALMAQACASAPKRRTTSPRRIPAAAGFTATAYCDAGITRSGTRVREGIIAADPAQLPLGTVVRIIEAGDRRYERVYTVMDTGGRVQGRRIDLYVRSCSEARRFGVRPVRLEVIRPGTKGKPAPRR